MALPICLRKLILMSDDEGLVKALIKSRGSAAELKLQLVKLRAELPHTIIFVFEGDDDRGVYFSWVRFLDATFRYEPFTCKGKDGVLKLKEVVDRDMGNLARDVFFFIDRDFDDARGVELDDSIYMTDQYSIENYLVTSEVLDEILKIEFHCHASPMVRRKVMDKFNKLYDQFLAISTDVNRELHAARRLKVPLQDDLGASISKFATLAIDDVQRLATPSFEVIKPVRPITPEELARLSDEFEALDPRERYRGKYALSFLLRWLELLARDRREQRSELFSGLDPGVRVRSTHLSAITLGSRSVPPESFRNFFARIPREEVA